MRGNPHARCGVGENPEVGSNIAYPPKDYLSPFAHRDYPFLTCNPDGILLFPDGQLELFEAKTTFWKKRNDWKDGPPDYYVPQPRHYLEVLNDPRLNSGHIGVCLGGNYRDVLCHSYKRDKKLGALQIQTLVDYWNQYIVPDALPPLSGNAELDMEAVYAYVPHLDGNSMDTLPDEAAALFEQYYDLQAQYTTVRANTKDAYDKEQELLEQIRCAVPEGVTICSFEGKPSIRINVKDSKRETVNENKLTLINPDAKENLLGMAKRLREQSLEYTTPKIKKVRSITTQQGVSL